MDRLKELIGQQNYPAAWARVRDLLAARPDYTRLLSLCRQATKLEKTAGLPTNLTEARIALLSGATVDMLVQPFRLSLIAAGIKPELHVGGYGQFVQEMIDPQSPAAAFQPRIAVVINNPYNLPGRPDLGSSRGEVDRLVDQCVDFLLRPCAALHERTGCDIVLNNLHPLPNRPAGNLGAKLAGDNANFIRRFNLALGDRAPGYVHIRDVAALVERVGIERFFDVRYWYHAKQPVSFDSVGDYIRALASLVGAILGKSKKLVALDLDNTLWGGIVGDDGLDGIEIGEGSAAGEAYKSFQKYLKELKDRGVLLAVCSKNEEAIARAAFTDHPEMVLRLDDFVAFKANWDPKSTSLQQIAQELSLGLDSFVFVDDNPAEREQIRQALPDVSIPELGDDPADYPSILDSCHFFEAVALTSEDRERTDTYKRRKAAADGMASAADLSDYLASLDMKAVIRPFDEASLERITQLTNKTNQFNLTTRRVTLAEMQAISADPQYITRSARLSDCFGDHGLVSVFMGRIDGDKLIIENWLMSCRVLKRGLEQAVFNDVLEEARRRGVREIVGLYLPTDRNALVEDHYRDLGFEPDGEVEGGTRWRLEVARAEPQKCFIARAEPGRESGMGNSEG